MLNVAVVTAFFAEFADYPPKWQARMREQTAEMTFWVGGILGDCHRNDTNAAKCSHVATAVQFVSAAAVVAIRYSFVFSL